MMLFIRFISSPVITTSMFRVDVHGIPCSSMTELYLKKDEKRTAAFGLVLAVNKT